MVQAFFQALVITLREGFEAFLIVAISLAYLRKSGRARLVPAVHWGIAAAIAASVLGGYALFNAPNQELLDGPLALVAAASVTWMIVHMWRAGRRMKGDIEGRLKSSIPISRNRPLRAPKTRRFRAIRRPISRAFGLPVRLRIAIFRGRFRRYFASSGRLRGRTEPRSWPRMLL